MRSPDLDGDSITPIVHIVVHVAVFLLVNFHVDVYVDGQPQGIWDVFKSHSSYVTSVVS